MNIAQKILKAHLVSGELKKGQSIGLRVDQTLTQDATGTMAWLQFEALGLSSVKTDLSVSYVDHNTLQMGFRNADDHRFLRTTAAKFGAVFSPPGTGICHQLHLENFAKPATVLIGSDSHTPTAGALASLAMGAGGLSVALGMAGEPYIIPMPSIVEIRLTGALQGFAQAKDIILELLRRLSVKGGVGKIFEYTGEGLKSLSVPERATIANMGAELGATASLFPSDDMALEFLRSMNREEDWLYLTADEGASYDDCVEIDLSKLVPMVAKPHMPDCVVPVAELEGLSVDQVAIGSCTNSSYADLRSVTEIMRGKHVSPATDVCISPGSRQVLSMLMNDGSMTSLLDSGVRLLECSCGPCIGMGSSPTSSGVSVRTFNRNFEGRSGTKDAGVYLASPVTAAFCAINGKFTDPKTWSLCETSSSNLKNLEFPAHIPSIRHHFLFPEEQNVRESIQILRGPNIVALETFDAFPEKIEGSIVLKVGDDITTDHIMPAGAEITSLRSNIPAISEHVFSRVDEDFVERAKAVRDVKKHGIIVGGENYGQGSSREHAALAPRHLGIRALCALSFARIHRANLVNFGILPLMFINKEDYKKIPLSANVHIVTDLLKNGELKKEIIMHVDGLGDIPMTHDLSVYEFELISEGGLLNSVRNRK